LAARIAVLVGSVDAVAGLLTELGAFDLAFDFATSQMGAFPDG